MGLYLEMPTKVASEREVFYWFVTIVFTLEIFVKVVAEGLYPVRACACALACCACARARVSFVRAQSVRHPSVSAWGEIVGREDVNGYHTDSIYIY